MATDPNKLNWRDRLKYYQSDPEAGRKELTRAQNQANLYKAKGQNDALKAAQHWMNQVNTVLGNNNPAPQPAQQSNRLLQQVQERVSQPIQPFTYDAESIKRDPLYTSGYESMQDDYQRATNRSIVDLGRRGIGNSQSAVTVTAANNQALARDANTKLMPQVIAQKYRQYMDQYNMQQQQNQDLLGLANTFGQRAADQRDFDYRAGRDQVSDRRFDQEFAYQQARDAIADEREKRQFDEDVRQFGLQYAIQQQNANTSAANARTSRLNADQGRLMDIWRSSGIAPEGIPGVAPGTPYFDPVAARNGGETPKVDPKESANNLTQAKQYVRDLTYDQAIQYAQGIQDYVSDSDYRSLLNYIDNEFN